MSSEVMSGSIVGESAFGLAEGLGKVGLKQGYARGEMEEERG